MQEPLKEQHLKDKNLETQPRGSNLTHVLYVYRPSDSSRSTQAWREVLMRFELESMSLDVSSFLIDQSRKCASSIAHWAITSRHLRCIKKCHANSCFEPTHINYSNMFQSNLLKSAKYFGSSLHFNKETTDNFSLFVPNLNQQNIMSISSKEIEQVIFANHFTTFFKVVSSLNYKSK